MLPYLKLLDEPHLMHVKVITYQRAHELLGVRFRSALPEGAKLCGGAIEFRSFGRAD